jgi:hypothetical protein
MRPACRVLRMPMDESSSQHRCLAQKAVTRLVMGNGASVCLLHPWWRVDWGLPCCRGSSTSELPS